MKMNPDYRDILDAMQLNVDDDNDLEDGEEEVSQNQTTHNMTAQRLLIDNNTSRLPQTDIVPAFTGSSHTGVVIGDSPLIHHHSNLPPINRSNLPPINRSELPPINLLHPPAKVVDPMVEISTHKADQTGDISFQKSEPREDPLPRRLEPIDDVSLAKDEFRL